MFVNDVIILYYYFAILPYTDSLVDMEEQDNECFCLEDGKGDKVCYPQGCDGM